jgi:hypothetical protein
MRVEKETIFAGLPHLVYVREKSEVVLQV